jgi:UDP-N-acetylmuramyl pentapeptide phosphotransferase/UDP-N-acetylglucosamine-1-phosphate transferase
MFDLTIHSAKDAWTMAIPAGIAVCAATAGATRLVLGWLRHRQILDHPNERSSHQRPTPRGGGLAVTSVLALSFLLLNFGLYQGVLGLGALALMAISWLDDRRGLGPLTRFLIHGAVIGLYLAMMPSGELILHGLLPKWADRAVTVAGWLWFVNLYNFMDGIDGITGVETTALGLGIALVSSLAPDGDSFQLIAFSVFAAMAGLGFLVWNWHPAKVFLGDSGSIPLGFVLGGLLFHLAAHGQLAAALILPGYYLADATITLLWRLKDGEKIWQAHRRHFYQRAVRGGQSHARVSGAVALGNLLLIACACLAAKGFVPMAGLAALLVIGGLLALFTRWAGGIVR